MEPSGGIVISEEVMAEIAATAARDVPGVSALVRQAGVSNLLRPSETRRSAGKTLRTGEKMLRYVKISGGKAEVAVELWLRLKPGVKIIAVASEVQRGVREALHTMTDITVSRVNLRITGIDF